MHLQGKRVVVVEDELAFAGRLCDSLRGHGAIVLGPAPTVFYAYQLIGTRRVDLAILDTLLHGEPVFPLADFLVQRGIPVLFSAGEGAETLPDRHAHRPLLTKPLDAPCIMEVLGDLGTSMRSELPKFPLLQQEMDAVATGNVQASSIKVAKVVSALVRRRWGPVSQPPNR